jgi:YVTN family beta-propeller protein
MTFRLALLFASLCLTTAAACAQSNVLLALNKGDNTLAIIDAGTMKVVGKVPVGDGPHEVVVSQDGRTAFVSNYGNQTPGSSISVIDIPSRKELRRVDVAPLLRPHGLVVVGGKLYFTAEVNRLIARYDPAANKIDWMMGSGQTATHMVVGSADQKRFYTTNIGSDSISAFELPTAPSVNAKVAHVPVGKQPEAIDLSPDAKEVWVGLNVDNGVDVVDTATMKVVARIPVGERPYRERFTPDGKQVVCTIPNTKELIVYDAATRKELRRMKLESVPLGIAFSPDSRTAYVTAVQPDTVLKIDLEKMSVTARTEPGTAPDGVAYYGK